MSSRDVDAFLAECDDVIEDWEGSIDAASWSADGSHQPARLDGDYYWNDVHRRRAYDGWSSFAYALRRDSETRQSLSIQRDWGWEPVTYDVPIWPADTDEALDAALRAAVAAAWERVMVEFRATMAPLADALCGLSTTFVVFDEWLSRPLTGQAETVAAPEFVLPPEMWERATRRRPLLDVPPLALPDSLITHAVRWADPEQPDATPPNPRAGLEAQESPYPTRQRRRGR